MLCNPDPVRGGDHAVNLSERKISTSSSPPFSEASEVWLRARQAELKASSIVKYQNILTRNLLPRYGSVPTGEIRREELLAYGRELLAGGLSPSSAGAILTVARSILCFAQRSGFTAEDPGPIGFRQKQAPLRVFSLGEQQRRQLSHLPTHLRHALHRIGLRRRDAQRNPGARDRQHHHEPLRTSLHGIQAGEHEPPFHADPEEMTDPAIEPAVPKAHRGGRIL